MTITREEWLELRSEVSAIREAMTHLMEIIVLGMEPEEAAPEAEPDQQDGLKPFPGFARYRENQGGKGNA